jgi:pimeloyl-ACP methyl ester carboxylesterase
MLKRTMETHRMRRFFLVFFAVATAIAAAPAFPETAPPAAPRLVEVRGAKFYVETFGSGAPIVFLHGGAHFFDNSFRLQRDYFASYRTVIGIDQRGHGHSPDDARPFSYREMAEDTAALIASFGVGPVDVVGHSDGGNVALMLARYHPEAVRRVAISGANLRGLPADEWQRRSQWSQQQVRDKVQQLSESMPPSFRADYQSVTPDGPDHWWTHLSKSYQLWITPVIIEPAELKSIKVPVLVIAGDHDFTSLEETTEIFRALPLGQLLILPATGHGTFSERPVQVNQAIRDFLAQPEKDKAPR